MAMTQLHKRLLRKWPLSLFVLTILLALLAAGVSWNLHRQSPDQRAEAYYEHARRLIERHEYAKAKIELRNALSVKNNMLPAWRSLAEVGEATQDWGGTIESLRAILNLDSGDIKVRVKLAKLLVLVGGVYQALELTKTSNGADSQNPLLLGVKAAILYRLNDRLGAVQSAKAALAIDPSNADALVALATERMAMNDNSGALQILDSDAAIRSTDLGIQLLKLKLFTQSGETQQVETLLRKLMVLDPQQIGFRRQLIKLYHDQN